MAQAAGYSFNSDTVAGSKVRDLAGYFLTGTIVGSAAIATGKTGYGDGLNCTGGGLQVPVKDGTYPIDTTGGLTVAAWVKLNTTTSAARCIASGISNAGATRDWALYASNASGNVEFKIEGATHTTSTSIRDSAWHHVMVVVNRVFGPGAETVKIVIDGTEVYSLGSLTTGFGYTGDVNVWWGKNGAGAGSETLDGLIDDARWWNDPVGSASWASIRDAEQVDLQLAVYGFDGTVNDLGTYGRTLTKHASSSFPTALYGNGLQSTSAAAGASGAVNFGDLDRLALTGYIRLDTAPSGSSAPIMAIANTGGTNVFRAVVNTDRTITLTWVTIYGTFSVTSGSALTVGAWTRYHFNMNPTYVGIRLGSDTQVTTSTGNSDPHLTPTVNDLKTLYIGGDAAAGGQVSFDYVNCTRNFIDVPKNNYWIGPVQFSAVKPTNSARGVYEFNENTGTTANDQSGAGNHLTLNTGATWIGTGVQGSALGEGTAAGQAAGRSTLTWSATPTGWSFAGWFKCRTSSAGARILVLRNVGGEVAHAFYLSGAFQVRLYGSGGNTGLVSPNGSAVTAETWTHLAMSCNGTTMQFFVNGVHYGSADFTQGSLLSPTILRVGGDDGDGSGEGVADVDSLQLFDTPLSRSSIQWLYENPGQFAASVPVTTTRATTWRVAAQITRTRATTWTVKQAVARTRATTWAVLSAVSRTRATTWNTLASVARTRSTTWTTLTSVSATRPTTWNTRASVAAGRSTTWDALASITIQRPTTWTTYKLVGNAWATSWRALARAAISRPTTWNVEQQAGQVTITRGATWDVLTPVALTRIATWDALTSLTRTRGTSWRTLRRVTSTRSSTWNVASNHDVIVPPGLNVSNTLAGGLAASNAPSSNLEVSNGV